MYLCLHCESLKTSMNNTDISVFNENAHYVAKLQSFFLVFYFLQSQIIVPDPKAMATFSLSQMILLSQQPRCFFNLSQRDYLNDDWNPCCDWIRDCCAMEITKTLFFPCFSDFWRVTDVQGMWLLVIQQWTQWARAKGNMNCTASFYFSMAHVVGFCFRKMIH